LLTVVIVAYIFVSVQLIDGILHRFAVILFHLEIVSSFHTSLTRAPWKNSNSSLPLLSCFYNFTDLFHVFTILQISFMFLHFYRSLSCFYTFTDLFHVFTILQIYIFLVPLFFSFYPFFKMISKSQFIIFSALLATAGAPLANAVTETVTTENLAENTNDSSKYVHVEKLSGKYIFFFKNFFFQKTQKNFKNLFNKIRGFMFFWFSFNLPVHFLYLKNNFFIISCFFKKNNFQMVCRAVRLTMEDGSFATGIIPIKMIVFPVFTVSDSVISFSRIFVFSKKKKIF
jgi:hypothetical protein